MSPFQQGNPDCHNQNAPKVLLGTNSLFTQSLLQGLLAEQSVLRRWSSHQRFAFLCKARLKSFTHHGCTTTELPTWDACSAEGPRQKFFQGTRTAAVWWLAASSAPIQPFQTSFVSVVWQNGAFPAPFQMSNYSDASVLFLLTNSLFVFTNKIKLSALG